MDTWPMTTWDPSVASEMGVLDTVIWLPGTRVWEPMMKADAVFAVITWFPRERTAGAAVGWAGSLDMLPES